MASAKAIRMKLRELSASIFENVWNADNLRTGRKFLSSPLIGNRVAEHYGPSMKEIAPWFKDPEEFGRLTKLGRLKQRGKGAPKKGEGRRAKRGKR